VYNSLPENALLICELLVPKRRTIRMHDKTEDISLVPNTNHTWPPYYNTINYNVKIMHLLCISINLLGIQNIILYCIVIMLFSILIILKLIIIKVT